MPFLSQSNFPRLWLLFQYLVGTTAEKRRLAILNYKGQKKILEIGCSVGNVSQIFSQFKDVEFTGIDIDNNALSFARSRLASLPNFKFRNVSLSELAQSGEKFDYILFANILHHVDDKVAFTLLKDVQALLSSGASLIVMEPEKIRDDYNLILRLYYKLELGQFRRHKNELTNLITSAGLTIKTCSDILVAPDSIPHLKVARFTFTEVAVP
jgi:2-polyprenyl-3-methyl-5-hydroxy-6-metoxy-1,4-benzoquinol methylase